MVFCNTDRTRTFLSLPVTQGKQPVGAGTPLCQAFLTSGLLWQGRQWVRSWRHALPGLSCSIQMLPVSLPIPACSFPCTCSIPPRLTPSSFFLL